MNIHDIQIYLPKYLSAESEKELFKGLKDFPSNIDERLYTTYLKDKKILFQGDGIKDMLIVNLPNPKVKRVPSIVLSNTCDIDPSNERNFQAQIVYAPIMNLQKYKKTILNNSSKSKEQINSHINAIKRQAITQIFYLPKLNDQLDESIVFLDRLNSSPSRLLDPSNIPSQRIFTLSDYGAYLFLLKLSIHFTRIQDKVERRSVTTTTARK